MPEDWTVGCVSDLAKDVVCGKTPSTKNQLFYSSEDVIPFITIPDMHNNVYALKTERYLSRMGADSQKGKMLPKNSVCISCIGTAGLVVLTSRDSQTNQQINSIIPKEGVSSFYIYFLMKSLDETINKLGQSGSTIVNLNKTQFEKIEVVLPSIESMGDFDSIVKGMFNRILQLQEENQRLTILRDTLLPKLMSGDGF